jgi:N-formylglutamate amidohydrolase
MTDVFSFHDGDTPLLVSVPHDGWQLPPDIVQTMSEIGRGIPDTDWHVAQLYEFARDRGASMIVANFSRYVVDLNRPADDAAMYEGELATGLCPIRTFAGDDIYRDQPLIDTGARVAAYWRPYHDRIAEALTELRKRHGVALLWDAHSITSRVPQLFDGELAVLNLGTWGGRSCDASIADAVMSVAKQSNYDAVLDDRFKGGHITRNYGDPDTNVHAIQLELAQRAYMHERTLAYDRDKAAKLRATLELMLDAYLDTARA